MDNLLYYGNLKKLDLHGLTREEALAELYYVVDGIDINYDGIEVVHGYHGTNVLKNLVRKEFKHERIKSKAFIDAGVTVYVLNK